MAKYLYNGVELLALPAYDTSAYPYAVIVGNANLGYYLWCSSAPLYEFDVSTVSIGFAAKEAGVYVRYRYRGSDGAYYWGEETTGKFSGNVMFAALNIGAMWANYDFYKYDDNTLVLAASDPVPVYNATEFWGGVALGLSGTGVPDFADTSCIGKGYLAGAELRRNRPKNIVAYSYNGVVLPKLPETDYPYAYLVHNDGPSETYAEYMLFALQNEAFYSSGSILAKDWDSDGGNKGFLYNLADGEWTRFLPNNTVDLSGSTITLTGYGEVFWCNHDIVYYSDNSTVHLSASDPIPVYG